MLNHWLLWPACAAAFNDLSDALIRALILAFPTEHGDYILDTDASNFGLGGVLSQIQDEVKCIIAYCSRALRPSQRKYCTTKREMLAAFSMCIQFRSYLRGTKFILRTDHKSLVWLHRFKDTEGMIARWLHTLQQFQLSIVHRASRDRGNADGLSRAPTAPCRRCTRLDCPPVDTTIEVVDQPFDADSVGDSEDADLVPLRLVLLLAYHASLCGGHLGRYCTLARLSHRFYWSGLADDVGDWLRQCTTCMKRKSPTGRHHPLGNIPTGHFWDRIAMDILDVCDWMDIATFSSLPITLASGPRHSPLRTNVQIQWRMYLWISSYYASGCPSLFTAKTDLWNHCAHYWDASKHVQLPITRILMGWWNVLIAHVWWWCPCLLTTGQLTWAVAFRHACISHQCSRVYRVLSVPPYDGRRVLTSPGHIYRWITHQPGARRGSTPVCNMGEGCFGGCLWPR